MSVLLAVWRQLDQQQRRRLVGLQFLSIVMGLSTVGGVAAVLPFFTALADPSAIRRNSFMHVVLQHIAPDDDSSLVLLLGVSFAAIVLITNTINLFGFLAINRFAFRVGDTLYVRLFDEYMHREYEFHTRTNSSALATKLLHETARVTSGILQQGLVLVTNLVTIICVAASMMLVNPVAAAAAIVGLSASYALIYGLARKRLLHNGQIQSRYNAARTRTVNESFAAIKEITLMQVQAPFIRRFAQQCRAISRATDNTLAISYSPKYILECITVFCLVAVALYLHSHTEAGGPWIAQLSFVGFAAYRLLPALQQSFSAVVKIRADHPAFLAIKTDLERARCALSAGNLTQSARAWRGRPHTGIHVRAVSFTYAAGRPDAVSAVSLVVPAGAVVGFVGPNGSGKTTLLDLISGLLMPQSGHIEVDGVRLESANIAAWQSTVAYVPQQVFLFDATLAENIAFGISAAEIDHERLEAAVRLARLGECVASLPNGYAELLGDRGCHLSGGQRQRVAIARALYRDASLLILDEITSSLDAATESEIVETLHALRPNRTILMIAHRAAALRHCDLVFELRNGRIMAIDNAGKAAMTLKTHATNLS
jgi:HlyD family secretion protein